MNDEVLLMPCSLPFSQYGLTEKQRWMMTRRHKSRQPGPHQQIPLQCCRTRPPRNFQFPNLLHDMTLTSLLKAWSVYMYSLCRLHYSPVSITALMYLSTGPSQPQVVWPNLRSGIGFKIPPLSRFVPHLSSCPPPIRKWVYDSRHLGKYFAVSTFLGLLA